MAVSYFRNFPRTTYSLSDGKNLSEVTNIFRRVRFIESVSRNAHYFYNYQIDDEETPEIIAHQVYKNQDYFYVVTMFNNITDPQLDWPMSYNTFQHYLVKEYGSVEYTQITTHHWQRTVTSVNSDGETTVWTFTIDEPSGPEAHDMTDHVYQFPDGSTVSVSTEDREVSIYDYETQLNNNKKSIRLLKPEYIGQVTSQLAKLAG